MTTDIFIDKRFLTNGRRSIIHMDNNFNLTEYIQELINSPGQVTGAQNGTNLVSVLTTMGTQTSYVELGGPLLHDTTISGAFGFEIMGVNTITLDSTLALDIISPSIGISAATTLNIETPNVLASTAQNRQVLTLIDNSTGNTEYQNATYSQTFTINDWTTGTIDKIIIPQTTHLRGVRPLVQVFNGGTDSVQVLPLGAGNQLVEIKITTAGDVELLTTNSMEFDGHVVIV